MAANRGGKRTLVTDPSTHFWSKVDSSGGPDACWPWTMSVMTATGYGQFNTKLSGRTTAHKFAYQDKIGPVPEGHLVDHTCHNRDTSCPGGKTCPHRRCCNPAHLEAVPSHGENRRRADEPRKRAQFAEKCKNGHPRIPENTKWATYPNGKRYPQCKVCNRERMRAKKAAAKEAPSITKG